MKKSILHHSKKMLATVVATLMVFQLGLPLMLHAQDSPPPADPPPVEQPAPEPEPVVETQTTQEPAPEPETVIVTGDVDVDVVVDNDINENQTVVVQPEEEQDTPPDLLMVEPDQTSTTTPTTTTLLLVVDDGATSTDATSTPLVLLTVNDANSTNTPTSTVTVGNDNHATSTTEVVVDGNSGENKIDETEGDAIIVTGDVDVDVTVDSDINSNNTEVPTGDVGPCGDPTGTCADAEVSELTVENDNHATTTTEIDVDANSGENEIVDAEGDAIIVTGDVVVETTVSNFVNTNITGLGAVMALDLYGEVSGDLDVSQQNGQNLQGGTVIDNSLTVTNTNDATVVNDVVIDANSGGNQATSTDGGATIVTGNVTVKVDLANNINTNITGNNWIYSAINIFGSWIGSLVLPYQKAPAADGQTNPTNSTITVTNDNSAGVGNNVDAEANSGQNSATGDGTNFVATGDATVETHIVNSVNTNIFDSSWDFIKINIFGSWSGFIYGLPMDAHYIETADGVIIYRGSAHEVATIFAQGDNGYELSNQNIDIINQNEAAVFNNVEVNANSGNNTAQGAATSTIQTGNVDTRISISNEVNTNLVGDDWNYTLINIFGNWLGNLEFGRPDLWITESVETETFPAGIGDLVTYTFTFGNNGDGPATDVRIFDDFHDRFLTLVDPAGGNFYNGGIEWFLGNLEPGETGTLSYSLAVNSNINEGPNNIENTVTIATDQDDRDMTDNTSGGSFVAVYSQGAPVTTDSNHVAIAANSGPQATLKITKTNTTTEPVSAGDLVSFTIPVQNISDTAATDVLVQDTLRDSGGNDVSINTWDLETVTAGESVIIEYDLEITAEAAAGHYINTALVEGWSNGWVTDSANSGFDIIIKENSAELEQEPEEELPAPLALFETATTTALIGGLAGNDSVTRTGVGQPQEVVETFVDDAIAGINETLGQVLGSELASSSADQPQPIYWSLLWLLLILVIVYLAVKMLVPNRR